MYFTTMDDYNKLKGTDKTLAEDEMMLYSYKTDYEYDSFTIDGVGTWKVETMKEPPIGVGSAMANMQGSYQVVVKDLSVIEKIATAYETINAKPLQDGTLYLLSLQDVQALQMSFSDKAIRRNLSVPDPENIPEAVFLSILCLLLFCPDASGFSCHASSLISCSVKKPARYSLSANFCFSKRNSG